MDGITDKALALCEKIKHLEWLNKYTLSGGTALALQLRHRLSEDLDFLLWLKPEEEKVVPFRFIKKELSYICDIQSFDVLGFDQLNMMVDSVKVTFYAPEKVGDNIETIDFIGNIKLANIQSILAMKIDLLTARRRYRDFFDIYTILKNGGDLAQGLIEARAYSGNISSYRQYIGLITSIDDNIDQELHLLEDGDFVEPKEIRGFLLEEVEKASKKLNEMAESDIPVKKISFTKKKRVNKRGWKW